MRGGRARQTLRLAPALIVSWALATFVAARLVGISGPDGTETLSVALVRSVVVGVTVGLAGAWLETGPLARVGRLFPLWAAGTYVPLRFTRAAVEADAEVVEPTCT